MSIAQTSVFLRPVSGKLDLAPMTCWVEGGQTLGTRLGNRTWEPFAASGQKEEGRAPSAPLRPRGGRAQPYPSATHLPLLCGFPGTRTDLAWPPCSEKAFSHFSSRTASGINSPGWWASGLRGPIGSIRCLSFPRRRPGRGVGFETGMDETGRGQDRWGARCLSSVAA